MISKEPKNDFLEIISVSFDASFEDLICSWEKKHLQRKWSFPEMVGNHFFQGNALQPPENVSCIKIWEFYSLKHNDFFWMISSVDQNDKNVFSDKCWVCFDFTSNLYPKNIDICFKKRGIDLLS